MNANRDETSCCAVRTPSCCSLRIVRGKLRPRRGLGAEVGTAQSKLEFSQLTIMQNPSHPATGMPPTEDLNSTSREERKSGRKRVERVEEREVKEARKR